MYRKNFLQVAVVIFLIICTASVAFSADLNSFFSDPRFSFPTLLKDVKFGMGESEIQKVVPDFKGDYAFRVKGNEGIEVAKDMSYGSLYSIRISLASSFKGVIPYFEQKWGKSIIKKDILGKNVYYWLGRKQGMRAELHPALNQTELNYFQYIPFETLFSEKVPTLPAQLKGIQIGSSVNSLMKAIPEFELDKYWLDLKGYFDVSIWYFLRNESTIRLFSISFPDIENVRSILIKQWGMPKKSKTGKEYWQNQELKYIDSKGNTQKGIFVVYKPEPEGFNHSIDFTPVLENYEYE